MLRRDGPKPAVVVACLRRRRTAQCTWLPKLVVHVACLRRRRVRRTSMRRWCRGTSPIASRWASSSPPGGAAQAQESPMGIHRGVGQLKALPWRCLRISRLSLGCMLGHGQWWYLAVPRNINVEVKERECWKNDFLLFSNRWSLFSSTRKRSACFILSLRGKTVTTTS
jgi:hypothetical protein